MSELLFVRHAESEWNAAGLWQGHADPPLSARGRAQAEEMAQRLAGERFAALYTSDLVRARETAAALGRALALEPRPESRLREIHVGAWTGLSHAEIEAHWPQEYARFLRRDDEARAPGGETRRELRERVRAALEEIAARHPGGRIVVVTHRGVVRSVSPGTGLENAGTLCVRRAGGGWAPV